MDDYIHDLEKRIELMINQNQSLATEKDQALRLLNSNKEYIKNVVNYLANKLQEVDKNAAWEALQVISKLDEKIPNYDNNKEADLVTSYVCKKLELNSNILDVA